MAVGGAVDGWFDQGSRVADRVEATFKYVLSSLVLVLK